MADKVFTFEEVAQHNKAGDCWLIFSGKVYDVSQFLEDHPGGDDVLLTATGKDAIVDFEDVGHSSEAIKKREELVIGRIDKSSVPQNDDTTSSPPNKSSTGSYNVWLYVLPLLIVGVALFIRFYSGKNEEEV